MSSPTEVVPRPELERWKLWTITGLILVFVLMLSVPLVLWLLVPKEALPYLGLLPPDAVEARPGSGAAAVQVVAVRPVGEMGPPAYYDDGWRWLHDAMTGADQVASYVDLLVWTPSSPDQLLSLVQFSPGTSLFGENSYVVIADGEGWVRGVHPGNPNALAAIHRDVLDLIAEYRNPFAGRAAYQMAGMLLSCHPTLPPLGEKGS